MSDQAELSVGDERVVDIGPIAHGGHFIAHSDGRTLFVRHAITGETVRVRVTDVNRKMVRADAIEVIDAAPDRVAGPLPVGARGRLRRLRLPAHRGAGPAAAQAGGADRRPAPVRPAGRRAARPTRPDRPRAARPSRRPALAHPHDVGHRCRAATSGLRRYRRHDVIPVDRCLIAAEGVDVPGDAPAPARSPTRSATAPGAWTAGTSGRCTTPCPRPSSTPCSSSASPGPAQSWWDLYAGAGLFAAFLGEAVGEEGAVDSIEEAEAAVKAARRALHDLPQVDLYEGDVRTWLPPPPAARTASSSTRPGRVRGSRCCPRCASVPPTASSTSPATRSPSAATSPSSPGSATASTRVRAFDAFPMTHHLETVAAFSRFES